MRECVCVVKGWPPWGSNATTHCNHHPLVDYLAVAGTEYELRVRRWNLFHGRRSLFSTTDSAVKLRPKGAFPFHRWICTDILSTSMVAPQPRLPPPWRISFQHTEWGSFCKKNKNNNNNNNNKIKQNKIICCRDPTAFTQKTTTKQPIFWCKMTHRQVRHTLFIPRAT